MERPGPSLVVVVVQVPGPQIIDPQSPGRNVESLPQGKGFPNGMMESHES